MPSFTIKFRHDTASNWTTNNHTLVAGEVGIETDTKKFKIGDGSTAWTALPYHIGDLYSTASMTCEYSSVSDPRKGTCGNVLIKVSISGTDYYIPAYTSSCGCQTPSS
jgi:hypothetical protein